MQSEMEDTTAVVGGKKSMEKTGDAYHMLEPGGPLAPPIFGRSVNPFPTRGDKFCPPITTSSSKCFHLPASLNYFRRRQRISKPRRKRPRSQ